jgi:hypothetical protein
MPKRAGGGLKSPRSRTPPGIAALNAWLELRDEQVLLADGFEEALVGVVQLFDKLVAVYDREKCIEILQARDGMEHDEAEEFFEFNTQGAYVGEQTPGFLVWRVP